MPASPRCAGDSRHTYPVPDSGYWRTDGQRLESEQCPYCHYPDSNTCTILSECTVLMTVDLDQIPVRHKACKQALADLLTALETQVRVAGLTRAQIEGAQNDVSIRSWTSSNTRATDPISWRSGPRSPGHQVSGDLRVC
jgi:hypothetical protein